MYREVDINKRHARIRIWASAYEGHQPPEPHLISESYFSLFFCSTTPSGRFVVWAVRGISQARILEWVAFPTPGDLPNQGSNSSVPHWQAGSLPLHHLVKGTIREVSPNHYCRQKLTIILPVTTQKTIIHVGRNSFTNRRNKIRKINIEDKN